MNNIKILMSKSWDAVAHSPHKFASLFMPDENVNHLYKNMDKLKDMTPEELNGQDVVRLSLVPKNF